MVCCIDLSKIWHVQKDLVDSDEIFFIFPFNMTITKILEIKDFLHMYNNVCKKIFSGKFRSQNGVFLQIVHKNCQMEFSLFFQHVL